MGIYNFDYFTVRNNFSDFFLVLFFRKFLLVSWFSSSNFENGFQHFSSISFLFVHDAFVLWFFSFLSVTSLVILACLKNMLANVIIIMNWRLWNKNLCDIEVFIHVSFKPIFKNSKFVWYCSLCWLFCTLPNIIISEPNN